jgi:hypothetical protein
MRIAVVELRSQECQKETFPVGHAMYSKNAKRREG